MRIAFHIASAAFLTATAVALGDTNLSLHIKDSKGDKVTSGSVVITRDGQPSQLMPFSNGLLATVIVGDDRFSLSVKADAGNFRSAYLVSLSARVPQQEIAVELRTTSEPEINKAANDALEAYFERQRKSATQVKPIPLQR